MNREEGSTDDGDVARDGSWLIFSWQSITTVTERLTSIEPSGYTLSAVLV